MKKLIGTLTTNANSLESQIRNYFGNNRTPEVLEVRFYDLNTQAISEKVTVTPIRNYREAITNFYKNKEDSNNALDAIVGETAKILAGDYYENGRRCWKWQDRIKKFNQQYKIIKKIGYCREELKQLEKIVNSNRYAKKRYPKQTKKLCKKLRREPLTKKVVKYLKKKIKRK